MQDIPAGALWFVLLAWALGSFAGGWLATLLAKHRSRMHALIVGGVLLLAGVVNMLMLPHPTWFRIVGVLLFLPAACLGASLVRREAA